MRPSSRRRSSPPAGAPAFQDVLIAASRLVAGADARLTESKGYFAVHKQLAGKVHTAKEYAARLRR